MKTQKINWIIGLVVAVIAVLAFYMIYSDSVRKTDYHGTLVYALGGIEYEI